MDTILYLYPARRTAMCGTPPEEKAELRRGKLKKFLPFLWKKGEDRHPVVTVSRTEYFFPDYHLVRVSVARTEGMDKEQAELALTELAAHGAKAPGTITGTDRGSGSHLCGVP